MWVLVAVLTAISILSTNVQAVDPDPSLYGRPSFLVLSVREAFGDPNYTMWAYGVWLSIDGRSVRRIALRRYRTNSAGLTTTEWANETDCPTLVQALATVEELPAPQIDVPGVGREGADQTISSDGVVYSLTSTWAVWQDNLKVGNSISLSSNRDTPLADWAEAMSEALVPCWGSDQPYQP